MNIFEAAKTRQAKIIEANETHEIELNFAIELYPMEMKLTVGDMLRAVAGDDETVHDLKETFKALPL